ncbi:MAG: DUF6050 family protein [Blautia sp.]|nr:DUF6050 family protein [Blautia sp.]
MTVCSFIKKGILPLIVIGILTWLGQYLFIVDGAVDWFRFTLVYGIPFGIPYMFFIIPTRWNLSGMLGLITFCVIVGAVFGSVVAIAVTVRGIWYVAEFSIKCLVRFERNII